MDSFVPSILSSVSTPARWENRRGGGDGTQNGSVKKEPEEYFQFIILKCCRDQYLQHRIVSSFSANI